MALTSKDIVQPRYRVGDVIAGKYRLEGLLGEGGMGAVWGAFNLQLEAPVAIKLLLHSERDHELLTQRLKQEAKVAAKLGHPAIVRIFDVGESEQGDPFIVMELLKGRSLAAWLATDGCLSATQAVQMLLPIADALAIAHSKGIIHRDLKPDNVFISEDEQQLQPKLVDFGIVKINDPSSQQTHLTQTGTVVGSPDYMSPEQARGLEVDHRTDIWSLCVVLYEAITGMTPFAAANANALLLSIVVDEPRPFEPRSEEEAELARIITRGLSKDREQRFQSMVDLGRALASWLIRQNVVEDVCGSSLEAKWISRASDPAALRGTRSSLPSFPTSPPASGVRPASSDLEVAQTHLQPVALDTASKSGQVTPSPHQFSRAALMGIGFAASLLIAALVALALRRPAPSAASSVPPPHESLRSEAAPEVPSVEPVPPVVPEPAPPAPSAAAPTPSVGLAAPEAPSQRPAAKPNKAQPARSRPQASPGSASSDLLSPY
ncbi:MAG: serine/threonine-protein kinase [Myxococcota bacterium]